MRSSEFLCRNTQYSRSAAAVEDALALNVGGHKIFDHHLRRLVSAGAKSLLSVDGYAQRRHGGVGIDSVSILGIVYDTFVSYYDWLETVVLPCGIPILVARLSQAVSDADAFDGKLRQRLVKGCAVEILSLDITAKDFTRIVERLKSSFSCKSRHNVASDRSVRIYVEFYLVISHNKLKFKCKIIKNRGNPTIH